MRIIKTIFLLLLVMSVPARMGTAVLAVEAAYSANQSDMAAPITPNTTTSEIMESGSMDPEQDYNVIADPVAAPAAMDASPTYKVTISWSGMSFTYHAAKGSEWNTDTLKYEGGESYWTSKDSEQRYGTISITATSLSESDELTATLEFKQDGSFTAGKIGMRFSDNAETLDSKNPRKFITSLNVDTSNVTVYAVPAVSGYMEPFNDSSKLGTVTLTITAESSWTDPVAPELPEIFEDEPALVDDEVISSESKTDSPINSEQNE